MKHNIQLSHTLTSNMYITLCLMMSTILDRSERDCECGYVERGGCSHYFSIETKVNIYHLAYSKIWVECVCVCVGGGGGGGGGGTCIIQQQILWRRFTQSTTSVACSRKRPISVLC